MTLSYKYRVVNVGKTLETETIDFDTMGAAMEAARAMPGYTEVKQLVLTTMGLLMERPMWAYRKEA